MTSDRLAIGTCLRAGLILAVSLCGAARGAWAQQSAPALSPEVIAQIDAIEREKDARTPTERKIDSHLLQAVNARRGRTVVDGMGRTASDLPQDAAGRVVVDITTTGIVAQELRSAVTARGGDVVATTDSSRGSMRATVSLDELLEIASRPDVVFIQPRQEMRTSRSVRPPLDTRAQSVSRALRDVLRQAPRAMDSGSSRTNAVLGSTGQGSASSEGDVTHRAFDARVAFGLDGTGIRIGVLSDGVTSLSASQASGDLGPVTVLPGQTGSDDEGTAMLEIIHDLAPGAQLFFATANPTPAQFAQNIRDLRAAGCDIIVDDVSYYVETPFQDGQAGSVVSNTNGGVVIEAVNEVTASGALYFSSAGNEGNVDDGTAGVWEGDFVDGGASAAPLPTTGRLHDFGGGQTTDAITSSQSSPQHHIPTNLFWSDPLGGSSNDYDLYVVNAAGTAIIDSSTNIQSGTQDPYEQVSQASGDRLVIFQKSGAAGRFLHVNTNRGTLSIATTGQTHGHSAAANAYSVAATPAATAISGGSTGPYPNPFSASNVTERFTSDGPRRIFFQADGTPYTPGNVSATGGILRQKPDITAADGVSVTGAGGFENPFFGTSAAAPHAAAIAALLKQGRPSFTPAQIRTALTSSAIDIEAPGVDRDSGVGIIMAISALQAAGLSGGAAFGIDSFTVVENPGNADGLLQGGEGGRVTVALTNVGLATATGITATLTTSTPGVTIHQPNTVAYPSIAPSAIASNSVPFTFTLASDIPCDPFTIDFVLVVTYAGGPSSPQTLHFSKTLNVIDINATLGTPSALPVYTASTGQQPSSRVTRNGIASTCGTTKAFPGLITTSSPRQVDQYVITTCAAAAPSCAAVEMDSPNGNNLFGVTYSNSFDPSNPGTNYLADAGVSGAAQSYGFTVPTASSTYVVTVSDVSGTSVGSAYHVRFSGVCVGSCTRNHVPVAIAQNLRLVAGPSGTALGSINNGSSDADADPLTITQSPAGPYPVGVTSVLLTVTDTKGATSQATATVTVVPSVAALAPASGPSSGGTVVTITGTGFSTTPGATTVMFGATPATNVSCTSITQCQATSPAGTAVVSVRVTVSGQTSADTAADDFTYVAPTVTALNPASGPAGGGTTVMITGTGFSTTPGATTVMFGAVAATNVTCVSTTQCQAISPAGTGVVNVSVTVAGQTSANTAADDFTFSTLAYLLAEGATGGFFDEDVLIANPNTVSAPVTLKFFKEDGSTVTDTRTLAPQSRTTVHADTVPGMEATSASVQVISESGIPLAVERSMFWDSTYYAGHTAGAVNGPSQLWYFAEGSQGFFETYVLVANATPVAGSVTMTFLLEGDVPVVKTFAMAASSRLTVAANSIPELANRSFAIKVESTMPVITERSMYFGSMPGRLWSGGHASGGSTLATQWYFAEGATGGFFDTFILLGNPQSTDAHVQVQYLLDSGDVITVPKVIPANTRLTINVEGEPDPRLLNAAFSTQVTSDVPIVAERSMYWPGAILPWGEAHNSAGVNTLGTSWALAEGRVGGTHNFHSYILLGNPQSTAANVTVTFLREGGAAPIVKTYVVPATSRFNIDVNTVVPELVDENFAAQIQVTNSVPIIVERSMYWDANGIFWSGGTNATGVPLP